MKSTSEPRSISKAKQSCPTYTAEQWLEHRDRITNLYVEEELTLKQVRTILEEDHQFPATERQIKRKIKEWNLDKNIKDEEMRMILQHKQFRNDNYGKDSIFYVRGRLVDYKKIQRFIQRKGSASLSVLPDRSLLSLPEDIICQTPTDETPPSFLKIDVQEFTTIVSHESGRERPEDNNNLITSTSSLNVTKQGETIEVDHVFLTDFWKSYWPNHTPGNDIRDFRFLDLPVQIPKSEDTLRLGRSQIRMRPRLAGQLTDDSDEDRLNKRKRLNTWDGDENSGFPPAMPREDPSLSRASESTTNVVTTESITEHGLGAVLSELQAIKGQQDTLNSMLSALGQKHNDLNKTAEKFNSAHVRHEKSVNAILIYLASAFGSSLTSGSIDPEMAFSDLKRNLPH
ncbi:hypothetical protein LTR84_003638 [Exophiala bonariae]|uniref:Clr5 domain-containing protein n=1 Tax=Exophiala bonariae TaxID=1690606 RepID=A0AAV9N6V6_9EURO|nr:hypothetical protein LTR84_003638 [Exophiala bonariae]